MGLIDDIWNQRVNFHDQYSGIAMITGNSFDLISDSYQSYSFV